eukprot:TRINITY_DN172_c0_g1_i6.p1 TRINITY_DN172_c0_g1~~TRINITY_DN172_c0_g1_i6.p1  ORF type:complete len:170 (+),score=2.89 TRINITY_DN172_c0_g1_i6:23-511(+)
MDFRLDNKLLTGLISPNTPLYAARAPQCRHLSGPGGRIQVKKYFIHPDFPVYYNIGADLAILELETPFDYDGPFIQIAQPMLFSQLRRFQSYVLGWGLINYTEQQNPGLYAKTSIQLRRGPLKLTRSRKDCRKRITESNIVQYLKELSIQLKLFIINVPLQI